MNILVTGGSGFIGSHFIEEIFKRNDVTNVYNLDANTYASNKNLPFESDNRYQKLTMDICASYFQDKKKYKKKKHDCSKMPNDPYVKLYYSALGIFGLYILLLVFSRKR